MKLYIWLDKKTGCEYWCVSKSLKLAQKYIKRVYNTADGFFDNPPNKIHKAPFAVSVLDPFRTVIYKVRKEDYNNYSNRVYPNDDCSPLFKIFG